MTKIHVAYARQNGEIRAKALAADVLDGREVRHSRAIAVRDTWGEAVEAAVTAVRQAIESEGRSAGDVKVICHGRVAGCCWKQMLLSR